MHFVKSVSVLAAGMLTAATVVPVPASAEDSRALIDALVRKGVLSTQEAEEIRAEMSRDSANDAASKIKLNDSITELKLYGDLRLRYQYDARDRQVDPASIGEDEDRSPTGQQRSRWRLRLRVGADFRLGENIFGGVQLQTSAASDSGNQTVDDGFENFGIYISRAYVGWEPFDWLTVWGGKMPNPFYTTDMVWDPDINPTGVAESIAFHKMRFGGIDSGYSKDGKKAIAPVIEEPNWELTLVAGQLFYDDNDEGGGRDPGGIDNDETSDAYIFMTQLIGSYTFANKTKLTMAPGWMVENAASLNGLNNENTFEDSDLVSGATRNLNVLLLPGDYRFKLGDIKTKFFWDLAYNIEGRKRFENIYRVNESRIDSEGNLRTEKNHTTTDDLAFLVGIQFGDNKKQGDWSVNANYRQVGASSLDPNLTDSDFALGEVNVRGFKLSLAYNFTDYAIGVISLYHAQALRDIAGGELTGGQAIGDLNSFHMIQVDMNVKF